MSLDNVESSVKIIVVGAGGVGKTSLLRRFCKGVFTQDYKKTIGTDFMEKDVYSKGADRLINLMLWDTAGQEVFDALTARYYRGAGGCLLCFSTVDRDSFMGIERWKEKVEAQCGKGNCVMLLVQTKCDLIENAAVSNEEAEALAKKLSVPFFRTSTKDDFNVSKVFEYLADRCVNSGLSGDTGREMIAGAGAKRSAEPSASGAGNGADPTASAESNGQTGTAAKSGDGSASDAPQTSTDAPPGAGANNNKLVMSNVPKTKRATSKRKFKCVIL